MSAPLTRFYFEPVSMLVGESAEEPEGVHQGVPDILLISQRQDSEYFFRKTVSENSQDFEVLDIQATLSSAVSGAYNSVSKEIKEKLTPIISPETMSSLFHLPKTVDATYIRRALVEIPTIVYLHKKSPTMIVPSRGDVFCIISNEAKNVKALTADLKAQCENLSRITHDFGLVLKSFLTGREYQSYLLAKIEKVIKHEIGSPKNEFEKEVVEACSSVTSSFLPNVNVQFQEPNECFEYDVFINLPPRTRFIIEPTNYESVQTEISGKKLATETLKSKIILATQDKAQRLGARSIVIVNGFPEETFAQLKTLANSRGIILMNETEYKTQLPTELCQAMVSALNRRMLQRVTRLIDRY